MKKQDLNYRNDKSVKRKTCEYCGDPFIVRNENVKFCRDKCRVYSYRAKIRAAKLEREEKIKQLKKRKR